MRNKSAGTARVLTLLSSLYFAQGLPYGFFSQALPVWMRMQGWSLTSIGMTWLLAFPWAVKIFWAPWVDRHGSTSWGHRRGWIVPLQLLGTLLLVVLAVFWSKIGFYGLLVAFFFTNLIAATQDVATDGLAVVVLDGKLRSIGNGIQVAGYRIGMIVGGGLLLTWFTAANWHMMMWTLAALMLFSTLPILLFTEPTQDEVAPRDITYKGLLLSSVTRKGMPYWLVIICIYKGGDALASAMIRPFLVDHGLSLSQIGWLVGTLGFAASLAGAITAGLLSPRLTRSTAVAIFGGLQSITVAGYYLLSVFPLNDLLLSFAVCAEHFFGGTSTVVLFTAMMDKTDKNQPGTDYTLQACLVVFATAVAGVLAGIVADKAGYSGLFLISFAVSAVGVFLVARQLYWTRGQRSV